jgi:hypothetical protein
MGGSKATQVSIFERIWEGNQNLDLVCYYNDLQGRSCVFLIDKEEVLPSQNFSYDIAKRYFLLLNLLIIRQFRVVAPRITL